MFSLRSLRKITVEGRMSNGDGRVILLDEQRRMVAIGTEFMSLDRAAALLVLRYGTPGAFDFVWRQLKLAHDRGQRSAIRLLSELLDEIADL
jgi:hypothetical protein